MKESVKSVKVSVQIFIQPASDAGEKKKRRDSIPRNYQERRTWERKKLPARIVEQAGVPIDRVIGLSRKRILIAHIWSMLS